MTSRVHASEKSPAAIRAARTEPVRPVNVAEAFVRVMTAPTPADVMALQRAAGNRAVQRCVEARPRRPEPTPPLQARLASRTGLPDDLRAGIERLSGLSMAGVRVHYNSPIPATVQARAFTRGSDIYLGPNQEPHLPHEAWHVAQQKRGRVAPTLRLGGVAINDDARLEREADVMGEQARQAGGTIQRMACVIPRRPAKLNLAPPPAPAPLPYPGRLRLKGDAAHRESQREKYKAKVAAITAANARADAEHKEEAETSTVAAAADIANLRPTEPFTPNFEWRHVTQDPDDLEQDRVQGFWKTRWAKLADREGGRPKVGTILLMSKKEAGDELTNDVDAFTVRMAQQAKAGTMLCLSTKHTYPFASFSSIHGGGGRFEKDTTRHILGMEVQADGTMAINHYEQHL